MADVTIIDVSPRDGLQNEPQWISTEKKVHLLKLLRDANVRKIETTSFVHPEKVPQMADAADVMKHVTQTKGFDATVLIPNLKGYDRAMQHVPTEVNWICSATETFNQTNIGLSTNQSIEQFGVLVHRAKQDNIQTCFSLAVSFGCPFEGEVPEKRVLRVINRALELGADRIGIADTIGIAVPNQVKSLMKSVLQVAGNTPVTLHLHDTRGLGLANAYAAYEIGVRQFETAVSGIGGCPFAPGAAGNLATEDLVYMFHRMNIQTGLDFEKLLEAADYAASLSSKQALGRIRNVKHSLRGGVL